MRSASERALLAGIAATLALWARSASADGGTVDPSYGRVEGDVALVFGMGAVFAPRGLRAVAEVRLRYLETAGLYATYEDANVLASAPEPQRLLATGLEVRPLFLFRWLEGYEGKRPWVDLALDSIGLELGALLEQPTGADFASRRGIEVGLGVELPLAARATGLWIRVRGGLRWSERALASGVVDGADDRQAVIAITLAWHQIVQAHMVDVGDRPPP
jgi:hypothetical protein